MTRQEFRQARRMARTFSSMCREAVAADKAGDFTLMRHAMRWCAAEFDQMTSQMKAVSQCVRPGIGLTTQVAMIRALPEQRAQRINYVRMARYHRTPCRLPA